MPPADTEDGITWTAQAQIIVPDDVAGAGAVRFLLACDSSHHPLPQNPALHLLSEIRQTPLWWA